MPEGVTGRSQQLRCSGQIPVGLFLAEVAEINRQVRDHGTHIQIVVVPSYKAVNGETVPEGMQQRASAAFDIPDSDRLKQLNEHTAEGWIRKGPAHAGNKECCRWPA